MSQQTSDNRAGNFVNIFSLQSAEDDKTKIAGQQDHVTNYNTINNGHTRTSSMETVWIYDADARKAESSSSSSPHQPAEHDTNFGIPSMLPTAHLELEYDPHEFGNADKPTSFWNTVVHLIIASAGPAILSLPIFFMQVGYGLGVLGTLFAVYVFAHSIKTLLWSEYEVCKAKRVPHLSYQDLIYFAFEDGPPSVRWFAPFGRRIIDLAFIVVWSSACCYNLTLSAENITIVYNQWTGRSTDVHVVMSWVVIPFMLLGWVRKLKYLVPVSAVANVANLLCIGIVIYDAIFSEVPHKGGVAVGSLSKFPLFLGFVFFSINATGLMLPLKKEMKDRGRFTSVLLVTYIPVFLMYSIFSLICTLKYGSDLKETVVQNLHQGHSLTRCMILANALALILQNPLIAYVVFDVIWNSLMQESKKTRTNLLVWEYFVRTAITVVVFLVCYLLPNIELFLTVGGNVGTMIDSLLFPAFIQMVVTWRVSKNKRTFYRCVCKNMAISLLATVLMVCGVKSCVSSILEYYGTKPIE